MLLRDFKAKKYEDIEQEFYEAMEDSLQVEYEKLIEKEGFIY
jgi:hypothetical protein